MYEATFVLGSLVLGLRLAVVREISTIQHKVIHPTPDCALILLQNLSNNSSLRESEMVGSVPYNSSAMCCKSSQGRYLNMLISHGTDCLHLFATVPASSLVEGSPHSSPSSWTLHTLILMASWREVVRLHIARRPVLCAKTCGPAIYAIS